MEIISLSNGAAEIEEKRVLYFAAGAQKVWTCNLHGQLTFCMGSNWTLRAFAPTLLNKSPENAQRHRYQLWEDAEQFRRSD